MTASTQETQAYQKGYAAGQRKRRRGDAHLIARAMREQFERDVFLAVLPELIREPWQTNGQRWNKTEHFVDGARRFAEMAGQRFVFTPMPEDEA